jgi:N-acetyl-1-D-myo-inositol-2-amino-2-deoxy-alpha-D-glucopyranoside deacetylase
LVVVILLVGVFVASLRIISRTRVPATLATAGVITAVTLLAGVDSQGSVMIAGNTVGLAFLGSVTLVSVVVLAWPKLTPRPTRYDGVSRTERTSRP